MGIIKQKFAITTSLFIFTLITGCIKSPPTTTTAPIDPSIDGTGTWNILRQPYQTNFFLDGLLLEWEYFMIHDHQGRFTGSVGYVLADPLTKLGGLMPSGANAAIAGKMAGVSEPLVDYINFPFNQVTLSNTERKLHGERPDGSMFADIQPVWNGGEPSFHLTGLSEHVAWDLQVSQDWADRDLLRDSGVFVPAFDTHINKNSSEEWLVNMVWPRTLVTGTITDVNTGTTVAIDGHGYRENSYGRFNFLKDGWDFGVVSDEAAGVQWAWQSYHYSTKMDFVDMSFYDNNELVGIQFRADDNELGWQHDNWYFDPIANQCTPADGFIVAQNDQYRVEVTMDNTLQVPMLSDITLMTKRYVINVLMPVYTGKITRVDNGETVVEFSGQGGGEFAVAKSKTLLSDEQCQIFGEEFSHAIPSP